MLEKILAGLTAVSITIAGLLGFVPKGQIMEFEKQIIEIQNRMDDISYRINDTFDNSLGSYLPVAGGVYYLKGSGMGTSDTSTVLVSFKEPTSEREFSMTDFGDIGYATIDPGTSKKEFISFTGITQDGSTDKATLTGVSRGLGFTYPYTASSSLAQSHSGGAKLIISNPPQHYEKYANKENSQTITGVWTFSSTTIPRQDSYLTPTSDYEFAPKGYIDAIAIAGASNANWVLQGLVELATGTEIVAGTGTGGTGAYLVVPNSFFNQTSSATNLVPVTNSSGKLSQGFLNLTEGWTISGNFISSATSTFATSTFSILPTFPTATPTAVTQGASVQYVQDYRTGWILAEEKVIATSTQSTVFTGLSGDTDFEYMIIARMINGSTTDGFYFIRPNDSNVITYSQKITGIGDVGVTSYTQTDTVGLRMGKARGLANGFFTTTFFAKSGSGRYSMTNYSYATSTNVLWESGTVSAFWPETTTTISSLGVYSERVEGIATNSVITLFKREK